MLTRLRKAFRSHFLPLESGEHVSQMGWSHFSYSSIWDLGLRGEEPGRSPVGTACRNNMQERHENGKSTNYGVTGAKLSAARPISFKLYSRCAYTVLQQFPLYSAHLFRDLVELGLRYLPLKLSWSLATLLQLKTGRARTKAKG